MSFVPLDRRFTRWSHGEREDIEALRQIDFGRQSLGWADLLKARRVVLLAEGGSGKSTEFKEQHNRLIKQGEYSFLATVERIGRQDFESALTRHDRNRLAEWRESAKPAWFFVDSVDEAKLALVSFEDALSHVADSTNGAAARAHIIISGRHTDWEFKRDLALLSQILPILEQTFTVIANPNELVVQALHRKKSPPALVERPMVVLMSSLDATQVEKFAIGKGISNVSDFLDDIENARLWRFASRPADLDWLVEYWVNNRAFSELEPMLALNMRARFSETNRLRTGQTSLDSDRAMKALDRIGAALVFGKRRDFIIPDADRNPEDDLNAVSLKAILPELTQRQQQELINSAIFIPAEPGRARLHNDNEGAVRSYLTARWLKRLRDNNCPWSQISELLFATTYGVPLIRPSMRDTAAWLALWDSSAAQEVLARDPMVLIDSGDPASLPSHVRARALTGAINAWASRPHASMVNHDSLRRFARPDIEATVKEQWQRWSYHPAIRHLLLMLIDDGHLDGCAGIALEAATDQTVDAVSQALAVRALTTVGSPESIHVFRNYLLTNHAKLDHDTLWMAVNELFPRSLSVEDLGVLIDDLTRDASARSTGIDFYGPKLAERIIEAGAALSLLRRLMAGASTKPSDMSPGDFERVGYNLNCMRALAIRILDIETGDPPREIFDLELWIGHLSLYHSFNKTVEFDLTRRLGENTMRRRAWFWAAVEKYIAFTKGTTDALDGIWQLSSFGYYPKFELTDTTWLRNDLRDLTTHAEKHVALDALLSIWRTYGQDERVLAEIIDSADTPSLKAKVETWLRPVEPHENLLRLNEQHHAQRKAADIERAAAELSWITIADEIRAAPWEMKSLISPSEKGIDRRMYFLWNVLRGRSEDTSNGAAPDIGSMSGLFNEEVIGLFRDGLIAHWRSAPSPILRCNLPIGARNSYSVIDMMGLDGVALEALPGANWAKRLVGDEPTKAAIYATFSLSKLPLWLSDLCEAHPDACAKVLRQYIASDVKDKTATHTRDNLERLSRADSSVGSVVEQELWRFVEQAEQPSIQAIAPSLHILQKVSSQRLRLFELAIARSKTSVEVDVAAEYLAAAFAIDGDAAIDTLFQIEGNLDATGLRKFANSLLPKIFGSSWTPPSTDVSAMSVATLERLIQFAFANIPPSEDPIRANGDAYTPDERDFARGAREAALKRLANMPGAATYAALYRFAEKGDLSYPKWHLIELARHRAESDSESTAWYPVDVVAFEHSFQAEPRSPSDLQRLALNRLADLEHQMLESDFGQAKTFANLPLEVDVQRWIADYFRSGQGKSFSIEREPHSADEKEPDLRIEAKASDARLPIEIKVAETWSRTQLEDALKVQLMGRYLRDENSRWGILLLVCQNKRPEGWEKPSGKGYLNFDELVVHLQAMADHIAQEASSAAQMKIGAIDVSKHTQKPRKKAC